MSPSKFSVSAHLNDEVLNRYLLGGLPAEDLAEVDSHLTSCVSCTSKLYAAVGFPFRILRVGRRKLGHYDGTEKRREHRIPTADLGQLQVFSPFSPVKIPIQVADISRNGIKVHTPQFAARGTIVQVVFHGAIILGEVRYCIAAGAEFDAGIKIQDVVARPPAKPRRMV